MEERKVNEETRRRILEKNERLIDIVIERAKRDFSEDIAIIGVTGSFATGDYHEKSDLDLIIIGNTDAGWGISTCFILDGVGYDIYLSPWDTRIESAASLIHPYISFLVDMKIVYCTQPEYMDRFNRYRDRALEALARPIGEECLGRALKDIDLARQEYAGAMLGDQPGAVRYAAGGVMYYVINAIMHMNNTYFKRSTKKKMDEVAGCAHLPENFVPLAAGIASAVTVEALRAAAGDLLVSTIKLHAEMCERYIEKPVPSRENLRGTYEEMWSNYRNKVISGTERGDLVYVFNAAVDAQNFLDEMTKNVGTKKYDLMGKFDPDDLIGFRDAFLEVMDEYRANYERAGLEVQMFDDLDALYERYLGEAK